MTVTASAQTAAPSTTAATPDATNGLHFAVDSTDGAALVLPAALQLGGRRGVSSVPVAPRNWQVQPPLPVYSLTFDNLAAGNGLANARFMYEYIYLIEDDGNIVATVETNVDRSGAAVVAITSAGGQLATQTYPMVLQRMAADAQVRAGSFEVRLLDVQRDGVANFERVFWLKSDSGNGDLFWVPPPGPSNRPDNPMDQGRLYTEAEFLKDRPSSARAQIAAQRTGTTTTFAATLNRNDSMQGRLDYLRAALEKILSNLKNAPPGAAAGAVKQTMADVTEALAEVNGALEFVREHPEADTLQATPAAITVPWIGSRTGRNSIYRSPPEVRDSIAAMFNGLRGFLTGASAYIDDQREEYPGAALRVPGALGGHRDAIIRSMGAAFHDLMAGLLARYRNPAGSPPSANAAPTESPDSPATPAPTGAISGIVVDDNLDPAANVLVSICPAEEVGGQIRANGAYYVDGGWATLSDDQGRFAIRDLTPGTYIIEASVMSASNRWVILQSVQPIEVKPGQETQLVNPFRLTR